MLGKANCKAKSRRFEVYSIDDKMEETQIADCIPEEREKVHPYEKIEVRIDLGERYGPYGACWIVVGEMS